MTRLHTDPVEVRRRDDQPDQFLWRGRLYVVREVLARWTESGGWWRGDAVRSLTAGDAAPAQEHPAGPAPSTSWARSAALAPFARQEPQPIAPSSASIDDGERDWWRVEAGTGRAFGTGVYDLCFDWSRGAWSLARVLD
ncbi:MAG: hypothetical protein JWN35_3707 [Frankiales bacterium]|jgi:hypothetical protein|nr:hypothetical protein [Frankiales bacterium]